jgi:hypothetical protein
MRIAFVSIANGDQATSCGTFMHGEIEDYTINIIPATPQSIYCSATSQTTKLLYIEKVTVNGSTNESGPQRYTDFSSVIFDVTAGTNVPAVLTPGRRDTVDYSTQWAIWIDYNKDGYFDDASELATKINSHSSLIENTTLSIDTGATGATRMRVVMAYTGNGQQAVACGSFQHGEVEDYTINIAPVFKSISISDNSNASAANKIQAIASSFTVYPNPVSGDAVSYNINLQNATLNFVRVFDIYGKVICEKPASQVISNRVEFGNAIAPGVYQLQLLTSEGNVTRTFVVTQ